MQKFFVKWEENTSYSGQLITSQTFQDLICACDGLILYIQLLIKKYPDAEITTYYLGSDQNEQLFAFIRTSYAGGRSINLDAATMAYGIEKRNVRSELSLREDTSVVAHTRRRTVMRPAVPSPMVRSCSFSSNSEVTTIAKEKRNVWTGRMIEVSKLAKCMD